MDNETKERIGETIRGIREYNNMKQTEFAKTIGITQTTLSSYEVGKKAPPLALCIRIAKTYNVSMDFICGTKPKKESSPNYSDLFSSIIDLLQYGGVSIKEDGSMTIEDDFLKGIVIDLRKYANLTQTGMIDPDIFETWADKQHEKCDDNPNLPQMTCKLFPWDYDPDYWAKEMDRLEKSLSLRK